MLTETAELDAQPNSTHLLGIIATLENIVPPSPLASPSLSRDCEPSWSRRHHKSSQPSQQPNWREMYDAIWWVDTATGSRSFAAVILRPENFFAKVI
jgi:hypothetical protein